MAKIGTLLENPNREMEIWGRSSMPFTHGLKLLPTPGPAGMHPLSLRPPLAEKALGKSSTTLWHWRTAFLPTAALPCSRTW